MTSPSHDIRTKPSEEFFYLNIELQIDCDDQCNEIVNNIHKKIMEHSEITWIRMYERNPWDLEIKTEVKLDMVKKGLVP